jgi:serine protease Do
MPIPKPEEPKEGGKKGDKSKGPGGKRPKSDPIEIARGKTPMPEICKAHFAAKRGYANYFMNSQQRDRVLKAWAARCGLAGQSGAWIIDGQAETGEKVQFRLGDGGMQMKLPNSQVDWAAVGQLNSSLLPPQSGGLLPALYGLRWLATQGPAKFDEAYYLGTAPLAGRTGLADVVVALLRGIECRCYFDPVGGDLLAMEVYPEDDADPCEIYFGDYRLVGARWLPASMEVRTGDDRYGLFKLDPWNFERAERSTAK